MKILKCHCGSVEAEIKINEIEKIFKMQLFNLQKKRSNNVYGKK